MNQRLRQLIQYATGGSQVEFAALMGWSPQYLFRLAKGESGIGLKPVLALLEKFPQLNARWLLLGEGAMMDSGVDAAKAHLLRLLSLEKYMPAMTPDELRQLTEEGRTDFPAEAVARWEEELARREARVNDAIQRSTIATHPAVVCAAEDDAPKSQKPQKTRKSKTVVA